MSVFSAPLNTRVVLPVVLTTVLATVLSAFLIFGKFDRSVSEFEFSRYSFLLEDIQVVFVRDLDMGLELDQIGNAQALLERHISDGQGVVALILFDPRGHVLARAGAWQLGTVPAAWVASNEAGGHRPWTAKADELLVAGMRLSNNFGKTVGGVALGYSRAPHQALLSGMAHNLTVAAAVISSGAVLLSFLLASLLISRTQKALKSLSDELATLEGDGVADQGSITSRFRNAALSALDDINAANAEILGLTEEGKTDAVPPCRHPPG
jgi:hypothetical protein